MTIPANRLAQAAVDGADDNLIRVLESLCEVTPDRVIARFRHHSLNYRDLARSTHRLVAITRAQGMDDEAAVVAAILGGLPRLNGAGAVEVTAVVEGALTQLRSDHLEVARLAESSVAHNVIGIDFERS